MPGSFSSPQIIYLHTQANALARQPAMLDGGRLDLTPQMFALLRIIAEQARQSDRVLCKETIDAQTGRPANEIVRDLRKALFGCGLSQAPARGLWGRLQRQALALSG